MDVTSNRRYAALDIARRVHKRIVATSVPTVAAAANARITSTTLAAPTTIGTISTATAASFLGDESNSESAKAFDGIYAAAFGAADSWRTSEMDLQNHTAGIRWQPDATLLWPNNGTTALLPDDEAPSLFGDADLPDFGLFYRHSLTLTAVYCVAYIFVFIVGLVGNSFVIAVVLRSPRMRTVTNFFIVNLAVADILVIVFCLPATLMSNIFVPWMLGWLMCKTVPYIQGVSVAASVYSLCAVSVDRFLAIWWPLKLQISKRRARLMILGIWVIALGTTVPWALFFKLVPLFPDGPEVLLCMEVWPEGMNGSLYFLFANLVACYVLPMVLITLCYVLIWIKVWRRSIPGDSKDAQMDRMQQKSKIKVVKMLIAVVILFVLSWMPLYYIFARIKLGKVIDSGEDEFLQVATPIAQWLGSSNSCINPILYAFFNKKYRRGFAAIIRSRSCCGRLRYYENVAIASSTTSTRKSSHYHQRNQRPPYSPSIKSDAVSYIYDQNSNRAHNQQHAATGAPGTASAASGTGSALARSHSTVAKQDSNVSTQPLLLKHQDSNASMRQQYLLKQDSGSSRQMLIKQESSDASSMTGGSVSRQDSSASLIGGGGGGNAMASASPATAAATTTGRLLRHQDSAGSKHALLSKQDSVVSYIETRRSQLLRQDSDLASRRRTVADAAGNSSAAASPVMLCKQDTQISFVEGVMTSGGCGGVTATGRKAALCRQDSVVSFAEPRDHRRSPLVKQDSVISFADQRRGFFSKQDSVVVHPYAGRGDSPHVSILKKTDSQCSSPVRKTIEFAE